MVIKARFWTGKPKPKAHIVDGLWPIRNVKISDGFFFLRCDNDEPVECKRCLSIVHRKAIKKYKNLDRSSERPFFIFKFPNKKALWWQLPTFAGKPTIIGLGVFHFRVRNGIGWDNSSITATKTLF